MSKLWKRAGSLLLVLSMMLSMVPSAALAGKAYTQGESYFDFDAADYSVREDGKALTVKIVRHGEGTTPANVAVKVADFLSVYGEDYEVLVDKKPLSMQEGTVIDPAAFTFDGDGDDPVQIAAKAETVMEDTSEAVEETEDASETVTEEAEDASETVTEEAETVTDAMEEAETASVQSAEGPRQSKSASPLRDMQAAYLQLPGESDAELMEDNAQGLFENMHKFFESAQGAAGIVYFGPGVLERELTVRPINNDKPDGSRMFLIGLMGTDTPETTVNVNATTYVTIEDDDAYEPATFSIADEAITLTREAPSAKVTITRTGGTQYFGTAYVSTVSDTAKISAYAQMNLKKVGFVPGQTAAEVTVTANDFTQGGKFGLRLEADEGDAVDNYYVEVKIQPSEDTVELQSGSESDPFGLGFAYELAAPEEAEAWYEAAAANLIPVSAADAKGAALIADAKDAVQIAGAAEAAEKGQPQDADKAAEDAKDAAELSGTEEDTAELQLSAPTAVLSYTTDTVSSVSGTTVKRIPFIPSVNGTYVFESTNTSGDPYGYLYNAALSQLTYNDDGAGNRNFRITYDLNANTLYMAICTIPTKTSWPITTTARETEISRLSTI